MCLNSLNRPLELLMLKRNGNAQNVNNGKINRLSFIRIQNRGLGAILTVRNVSENIVASSGKNIIKLDEDVYEKKWLLRMAEHVNVVVRNIGNFLLSIILMELVQNTEGNLGIMAEDKQFTLNSRSKDGQKLTSDYFVSIAMLQ